MDKKIYFRIKILHLVVINLFFAGCLTQPDPQKIIDEAIAIHGGQNYAYSLIEFDFRNKRYTIQRDGGLFTYKRTFIDSTGVIQDVLKNESFDREINGEILDLPEKRKRAYASSINSVVYFVSLPYPLNDSAVNKQYIGESYIGNEPYHKIKITFDQKGGGKDYNDIFVYWIHQKRYTMDYLAYVYHVDGGGMRFREAINPRVVKGIRFADFNNYKISSPSVTIEDYDRLFELGQLTKISSIVLENVQVKLLSK